MVESLEPLLAGIVATAPDSERAVPRQCSLIGSEI